jgi:hypothetical protein
MMDITENDSQQVNPIPQGIRTLTLPIANLLMKKSEGSDSLSNVSY